MIKPCVPAPTGGKVSVVGNEVMTEQVNYYPNIRIRVLMMLKDPAFHFHDNIFEEQDDDDESSEVKYSF